MRRAAAAVLLALAIVAPAGGAADPGPTVASSDRFELHALTVDGSLCITVVVSGDRAGRTCLDPPTSAFAPVQILHGAGAPYAAAVASQVAEVGLQRDGGEERYPTVAADGFAARFLLVPGAGRVRLVRFYGADGTLLGAATARFAPPGPTLRHAIRIGAARVVATTENELAPTPQIRDRVVAKTCAEGRTPDGSGVSSFCDDAYGAPLAQLESLSACAPSQDFVYGLTAASVDRVELRLGDGRRVRTATRSLPAAFGGRLAVGVLVPRGAAVRFAWALDAGGRRLARIAINSAPGGLPCDDVTPVRSDGFGGFSPLPPQLDAPAAVVAEAAGRRLRAGDSQDRLCVGFGTGLALTCEAPPLDGTYPYLQRAGRALGGVVSRDVASLTVRFADGGTAPVPLADGAAYTGQYAGAVRFAATEVPAGRTARRVVAFDAGGRRLGSASLDSGFFRVRVIRVLAGTRRTGAVITHDSDGDTCVVPRLSDPGVVVGIYCDRNASGDDISVAVSCRPRRTIIVGWAKGGRPAVGLATGRRAPVRHAGHLWGVVLGRRARVRSVTVDGHTTRVRVLPAARQCGYSGSAFLDD